MHLHAAATFHFQVIHLGGTTQVIHLGGTTESIHEAFLVFTMWSLYFCLPCPEGLLLLAPDTAVFLSECVLLPSRRVCFLERAQRPTPPSWAIEVPSEAEGDGSPGRRSLEATSHWVVVKDPSFFGFSPPKCRSEVKDKGPKRTSNHISLVHSSCFLQC